MPKRSPRGASSPARGLVLKTPSARARRPPGEPLEARASPSATSTRSCSWVRLFPHKALRSVITFQKVNECFLSFLLPSQKKKKHFLLLFDQLSVSCSGHPRVFQLFVSSLSFCHFNRGSFLGMSVSMQVLPHSGSLRFRWHL
jgi:hypothetical protein